MKPIGIDVPIRRGNQGFFQQTFTTGEAIKVNIRNLLLTNNGERPMNPEFGNNLNELMFEQDDTIVKEKIRDKIVSIIGRYIPSVKIERISFDNNPNDNNINFTITFSLKQYPNFIDRIEMQLQTG